MPVRPAAGALSWDALAAKKILFFEGRPESSFAGPSGCGSVIVGGACGEKEFMFEGAAGIELRRSVRLRERYRGRRLRQKNILFLKERTEKKKKKKKRKRKMTKMEMEMEMKMKMMMKKKKKKMMVVIQINGAPRK